jgi:hypothetical protein
MKALAQNTLIQNRYLVVHLIGKGGMGEVYLAVDQRLGSAVALKRTYFAGDEMLGNAFEREARILARMRHPVLPKVSDHFGENEEQYLVMEHISGDDLAKRLESSQKPFPVSWVLFWADQLLDALSYLHSHEPPIIHRDIKPQNLKLTDENHIILLDFGLSKSSTGQTNVANSGSTGSVVGYTPHYAPMEQIRGIGTNPRSDIYSLSATLYQLMTYTVPDDALSRADTMLNGMPDPITPPHELNPEIPKNVSDVILKGMEVSQDKRFANARDMQKVLRKAFTQMQEAMSAQTVAFDMNGEGGFSLDEPLPSSLKTEIMNPAQFGGPHGEPAAEIETAAKGSPAPAGESGSLNFDATLAFDNAVEPVKQADVKTEVFLAGSTPFEIPENDNVVEDVGRRPGDLIAVTSEDIIPKGEDYDIDESLSAPSMAVGNGEVADQPNAFATVATSNQAFVETPFVPPPLPAADQAPKQSAAPMKKSSGRAFAVLGGLAALLVLGLGVAGAGWYLYNNYAGNVAVEPTPTPEATVEITPSPEPTFEAITNSNIDNSNSVLGDTNTSVDNSNEDLTVGPTPVPQTTTPGTTVPRPTPQVGRVTPVRTPAPKATPKSKRDDRTIILQ